MQPKKKYRTMTQRECINKAVLYSLTSAKIIIISRESLCRTKTETIQEKKKQNTNRAKIKKLSIAFFASSNILKIKAT
jgi:hypothetical protein